jgi:hypothetical protein
MCIEIIGMMKDKHKELMSKTQNNMLVNKLPSANQNSGVQQPRVIRHQPEENKNSIGGGGLPS